MPDMPVFLIPILQEFDEQLQMQDGDNACVLGLPYFDHFPKPFKQGYMQAYSDGEIRTAFSERIVH